MAYHIDAESVSLDDLRKRIEATDLVPSRVSLLEKMDAKMKALKKHGITTLAALRHELKTAKRLEAVAAATGIETEYLVLLRREVEGYFPKPFALKDFDWLPRGEIAKLERRGIRDTAAVYTAAANPRERAALAQSAGVEAGVLDELARLADLTRVQWVSPTAARMLLAADCTGVACLANADAEALCAALARVNAGDRFFKGKIGLRDVRRLVHAAGYVA